MLTAYGRFRSSPEGTRVVVWLGPPWHLLFLPAFFALCMLPKAGEYFQPSPVLPFLPRIVDPLLIFLVFSAGLSLAVLAGAWLLPDEKDHLLGTVQRAVEGLELSPGEAHRRSRKVARRSTLKSGGKRAGAMVGRREGAARGRLTKQNLPADYGPLPNAGLLLLVSVGTTVFALMWDYSGHHPLWHAFAYGLPLGVAAGLIFVPVWMRNAAHFMSLPPLESGGRREGGLYRFIREWKMPEARQTTLVLLGVTLPMAAINLLFLMPHHGQRPDALAVGPFALSLTSFTSLWGLGYLVWWWRLPPE